MNIRSFTLLSFIFLSLVGCSPKEQTTTHDAEKSMKISGEAFYRERIAVPPEVQFEVFLEDVSLADAPAKIIGRQQTSNAGQPPYKFDIDYLPSAILAGHRYNLRARLTLNGELLFTTDQTNPVFAAGQENQTKLLMQRVTNPEIDAALSPDTSTADTTVTSELMNTYWKLITLNGTQVTVSENQSEPHLVFNTDSRVAGSDGCNRIMGSYTQDGNKLSFTQMASTMMACLNGNEQAQIFSTTLAEVAGFHITGDQLDVHDETGAVIASFKAVALQ